MVGPAWRGCYRSCGGQWGGGRLSYLARPGRNVDLRLPRRSHAGRQGALPGASSVDRDPLIARLQPWPVEAHGQAGAVPSTKWPHVLLFSQHRWRRSTSYWRVAPSRCRGQVQRKAAGMRSKSKTRLRCAARPMTSLRVSRQLPSATPSLARL